MPSRAIVLSPGKGTVTVVWRRFFHGAGVTRTKIMGFCHRTRMTAVFIDKPGHLFPAKSIMRNRGVAVRPLTGQRRSEVAMDESRLSPYPHLSWFAYGLTIHPPRAFVLHEYKAVTHRLIVTSEGDADFLWSNGAEDVACHVTCGSLGFFPSDSGVHSLGVTTTGVFRGSVLLVPSKHLEGVCEAEGARHAADNQVIPVFRDALLLACALRLLVGDSLGNLGQDVGAEIAARQLLMRLAAITGGQLPDWRKDTSVFTPRVMTMIVERVDAHLRVRASLQEISSGFGLSPSHFARKFQQSTGLSLNRFMNRRRIGQSFALLKIGKTPLAQLSLDLGFSSQSHFTRLFSGLTGLTPYQFRRTQSPKCE
jgi:AraC-like DNA-binding protein